MSMLAAVPCTRAGCSRHDIYISIEFQTVLLSYNIGRRDYTFLDACVLQTHWWQPDWWQPEWCSTSIACSILTGAHQRSRRSCFKRGDCFDCLMNRAQNIRDTSSPLHGTQRDYSAFLLKEWRTFCWQGGGGSRGTTTGAVAEPVKKITSVVSSPFSVRPS
jgi:hypothetical protein